MKKQYRLVLLVWGVLTTFGYASFNYNPPGTTALALSYAGSAGVIDVFSVVNNPALAPFKTNGMGTSYRSYYGIASLANMAVAAVFKIGQWPLMLSAERSGFNLYAETTIRLGTGYVIAKNISVGLAIPVYNLKIKNYGNTSAVGITLAAHYRPVKNMQISAIGGNLNRPALGRSHERAPAYGILAVAYQPSEQLGLWVDIFKDENRAFESRFGVGFQIFPALQLLAGYREGINSFSAGTAIKINGYHLRYALELHPQLGVSHTVGLSYDF